MNKIYMILGSAMMVLLLTNCGKKTANVSNEMSASCYYQQTQSGSYSNSCNYNYSAATGFTSLGMSYAGSGGLSCPSGYAPVYSSSKGVGCVYSSYITSSGTPVVYSLNQSTGQFTADSSNYSSYYSAQTYRVCNDSDDKCPSGQSCRNPFGSMAQSSLGICYR